MPTTRLSWDRACLSVRLTAVLEVRARSWRPIVALLLCDSAPFLARFAVQ